MDACPGKPCSHLPFVIKEFLSAYLLGNASFFYVCASRTCSLLDFLDTSKHKARDQCFCILMILHATESNGGLGGAL